MRRRAFPLWSLLPPIAALWVYSATLQGDFTFDDIVLVSQDPGLRELDWERILRDDYWGAVRFDINYRPFVLLTYALNHQVGHGPFGFHLVNVLLHALVAWVVFFVLREIVDDEAVAALGAALFAALPITSEAVAGIVGRAELLAALAVLGSWLLVLRNPGERSLTRVGLVGLAVFLGVSSKESAVVVVPLLLVAAPVLRKPLPWKSLATAAAAIGAYLLLRWQVVEENYRMLEEGRATLVTLVDNPLYPDFCDTPTRILNAVRLLGLYLWKIVVPVHLSADHSYNQLPVLPLTSPLLWLEALGLVGALALGALLFRRRVPSVTLGVLFFPTTFLVTCNVFLAIGTIFAERLAYLPSLAWPIVISGLLKEGLDRGMLSRRPALLGAALLVAVYGARTVDRSLDWRDKETLNEVTWQSSPESVRAQMLGSAVAFDRAMKAERPDERRARFEEALQRAGRALEIYPEHARARGRIARIHLERGDKETDPSARLGDFDIAVREYTAALEWLARNRQSEPEFRFHRARAELGRANVKIAYAGELPADHPERLDWVRSAIESFRRAASDLDEYIAIRKARSMPEKPDAFNLRGLCRPIPADYLPEERTRLREVALGDFDRAVRLRPDEPEFRNNRGFLRWKMGDLDGAISDYEAGLRICEDQGVLYDPQKGSAWSFLRKIETVHRQRGDIEAAERASAKAARIRSQER